MAECKTNPVGCEVFVVAIMRLLNRGSYYGMEPYLCQLFPT